MTERKNQALLCALALTWSLTACEHGLLHEPAAAPAVLGLNFSLVNASAMGGAGAAYDKADSVRVAVFKAADFKSIKENFTADFAPIGALLVTSAGFTPQAENRVQVELDLENDVEPLVVIGALSRARNPLFAGITTVLARRGEVTSSLVTLVAIPSRLGVAAVATMTALNDSALINAVVLFATDDTITGIPITYRSSNTGVATVDAAGRVIARAEGQAQITVTAADQYFTLTQVVNVTVAAVVTSITVTPSPASVDVGGFVQLTATARDRRNNALTNRTFTWSTSLPSIASVDANGRVTGVAAGTATITARSGTVIANVQVTVVARPRIVLSTSTVLFNMSISDPDPPAQDVNITNTGGGTLTGINVGPIVYGAGQAVGWLSATLSGSTGSPVLTLRPARASLPAGTYTATVPVLATNADNSPQNVSVTFVVTQSFSRLAGQVINAVNRAPIPGAIVTAVTGQNPPIAAATDAGGNYSMVVPSGSIYQVTAAAQGFIGELTSVSASAPQHTVNFVLSPVLGDAQYRIVLTWGANPADLDSHLFGPLPGTASRFEIFYGSPGSLTGVPYARLDTDDVDGFGPETVTIGQQIAGRYVYAVHHFSGTGTLATSVALVRVFRGSALIAEFRPPDQAGTIWNVFALNGATLTPIQTIGTVYAASLALSASQLVGLQADLDEAQRLIVEAARKYRKQLRNP